MRWTTAKSVWGWRVTTLLRVLVEEGEPPRVSNWFEA
jgi:hypothetical protein